MKPFQWVIDRIKELAAEYPDRIAQCRYFNSDGSPECIVGHVLHELGAEECNTVDGIYLALNGAMLAPIDTLADILPWEKLGVEKPTREQVKWVVRRQASQDRGDRWHEAVA